MNLIEKHNGGPVHPVTAGQQVYSTGMSLRDWFAGQWIAAGHHGNLTDSEASKQAYAFADAMLAEREKGGDA